MSDKAPTILLVEDNPAHAELVMRCFENHRLDNLIHHVVDGEAALDYLFRRGAYADPAASPRPSVILLDLRLPKIDGLEVLKTMKRTEAGELARIPVVVLTTSHAQRDVDRAYAHHANSYLVKPLDFERLAEMLEDVGVYWLGWNYGPWPPQQAGGERG
ncbi:MAG: response regulator [Acidobacteria bacterium]|nr:MAG: response regulator [Acidobacteriota bacterium]